MSTTAEISGKSTRTMLRTISLLKLPPEIQATIRAGNLPVSQGYLFAANLDCPDRDKIFEAVMKTPVTYITHAGNLHHTGEDAYGMEETQT
ncbi:MAG: hypothetical protein NTX75_04100 [Proteobacteria bacterium]|nr:hypothetical protein [Pseudomonadota bacterium]